MVKKIFFYYILGMIFILGLQTSLNAKEYPKVAVFGLSNKSSLKIFEDTAIDRCRNYFKKMGRFFPVSSIQVERKRSEFQNVKRSSEYYLLLAKKLKVDLYVTIVIYRLNKYFICEANFIPINGNYHSLKKSIKIKSSIILNIPLLLCREIVKLHKNIPVYANVTKVKGSNLYNINAGQWNGLKTDTKYRLMNNNTVINILQCGRFSSYLTGLDKMNNIVIDLYPDIDDDLNEINNRIEKNVIKKYGIEYRHLKGLNGEKKLIEGICVINPLGNVFLPVYGSYLSTSYLGFKDPVPDYYGMSLAGVSFLTQLFFIPAVTEFKASFLPWKNDRDKTDKQYRLHKFLWATIPFTFTTSFLNQLTNQYYANKVLPPLFENRNIMSGALSVVCPGGGLFYKGYPKIGWSYFLSEMSLAGYGFYYLGDKKGKYAFIGLGALKLLEIVNAVLIKPGYSFYNNEIERENTISFLMGFTEDQNQNDLKFLLGARKLF